MKVTISPASRGGARRIIVSRGEDTSPRLAGSPDNLVKQLSDIYPCRKGQMDEASRVALRKVILGLFTPSYGRFSFTKSSGEPLA